MKNALAVVFCVVMVLVSCSPAMAGDTRTRGRLEIPAMGIGHVPLLNGTMTSGLTIANPNDQWLDFSITFYGLDGTAVLRVPESNWTRIDRRATAIVETSSQEELINHPVVSATLSWRSDGDREPSIAAYFMHQDALGNTLGMEGIAIHTND